MDSQSPDSSMQQDVRMPMRRMEEEEEGVGAAGEGDYCRVTSASGGRQGVTVGAAAGGGGVGGGKKDKVCLVCGDRALGYNFSAVSCESCKAFFRRNAHKTIRGRCEGKCDVTVESRSFCKKCRLAKCFSAGMRKDMILNDEQKKVRKRKILYNKMKRQGHQPPDDVDPEGEVVPMETTLTSDKSVKDVEVGQETTLTSNGSRSCTSPGCPPPTSAPSWGESKEATQAAIAQLPEQQRKLVEELQYAMEASSFLGVTSTSMHSLPTTPAEFINLAEGFVRKVIKVAKKISAFKTLQKDDQIWLLKGSVVDIMMLRSVVNYNPSSESWSLSTKDCLSSSSSSSSSAQISAELLKNGSPEMRQLFSNYSRFVKVMVGHIRGDLLVLELLIMMSLFSADRTTLLERDKVHRLQESYASVLQSYTRLRFAEDKTLFARLVVKLTDLRNINEVHSRMLMSMKASDMEPLLLEIFNL
ncbi:thyroid hormone receptor beta-like [Babylonia areolata]|uniref:thyroid hormone receptor beta-like n=1 Tax=Babylonia areolata TaxID=304850 RepID=UPI003FD24651